MSSLDIMKDEIKPVNEDVKVSIIERLLQVKGDLLEYQPFIDENVERATDVFLCIDRISPEEDYKFMINIID